ncbi:MAG: hypothetical protein U0974_01480 [Gemmatimonadales bacterium]|nr:hypothetical protein [Gemmatimonadales bacterium]MDZ4388388.1 hypothetical protein [Gemmatimonadales bacterium]
MQQQEKVVLGLSLLVTLMAGWVQVGEADDTAERRQKACFLIETNKRYCTADPFDDCTEIAERFNCFGALLNAHCSSVGSGYFLLRCEFWG